MATTTSTPSLQVNGATAPASSSVAAAGAVPGKRAELRMNMLKTFRPLPLRHEWAFWHDRSAANSSGTDDNYEDQLKEIASISTIQVTPKRVNTEK